MTKIPQRFIQPTVLYDGACPMCISAMNVLRRVRWPETVHFVSWQHEVEQDPELQHSDLANQVKQEMVFILPDKGEVVHGVAVFENLLVLKPSTQWLGRLMQVSPIHQCLQWIYEAVANHRRVLTPSEEPQIACDCEPVIRSELHVRFYGILLVVSLLGVIAFSSALAVSYQERALPIIMRLLIAMGGGWLLSYAGLFLAFRDRFKEYLKQSVVVMTIGSVWLFISAVLIIAVYLTTPTMRLSSALVMILALNLHTAIMLFSTIRRTHTLHLPSALPWVWLMLYFGGYLFLAQRLV